MTYARAGRPTKQQQAARAELDRRWAIKRAKIDAHERREIELAHTYAELDGRDRPTVDDLQDAWKTLDAERLRIMAAPW